jgi:L-lysine exporter family protein LysE/ArgO
MDQQIIAVLSGFGLCLGLILSIGAQNAMILRHGLRREHVGMIVLVCIASDVAMQVAGVAGLATLVTSHPWLEAAARWAGAAVVAWFGLLSARRAWRGGGSLEAAAEQPVGAGGEGGGVAVRTRSSRAATLATILAVTWLNPHVMLESVVILGSVAAGHGEARWWFLVGTIAASVVWFVGFGYGARYLAPLLRTERAWRVLDGGIAVVMLGIAIALVVG